MKIFEKFALRKKNLNETENFLLKNQYFANFSKQILIFYGILFFKTQNFQKFSYTTPKIYIIHLF